MTRIDPTTVRGLDELNLKFWEWLETDYQRKVHSALNMTPLDFFMAQANQISIYSNPAVLEECLLMRVHRKVNHDATLSIDCTLYETDPSLANSRLEIRYDPEWLKNPARPLLLYTDGLKVGEARQVNFQDNSRVKRPGRGRPPRASSESPDKHEDQLPAVAEAVQAISFSSLMDREDSKTQPGGKEGGR